MLLICTHAGYIKFLFQLLYIFGEKSKCIESHISFVVSPNLSNDLLKKHIYGQFMSLPNFI